MFSTGAHIIRKYSPKHDYLAFVKDRIFTPLGMTSSTFSPTSASELGNLSDSWTAQGRRIPFWYTDSSVDLIAGAGGIITNVVDLSRWLKMLLNKGVDPISNATVLSRTVFDMVTTSHSIMSGKPGTPDQSIIGYGMGW